MIGGRGRQALGSLCVWGASHRALPPVGHAYQHPGARAPPLSRKGGSRPRPPIYAQTTESFQPVYRQAAQPSTIPARDAAGPGGGAALAQLWPNPIRVRFERNST